MTNQPQIWHLIVALSKLKHILHTNFIDTPACEGRTDFFFCRECFCFLESITAPVTSAMTSITTNTNRTTAVTMTPRDIDWPLAPPTAVRKNGSEMKSWLERILKPFVACRDV